jgi:predicted metal-binding membrane protein
MNGEAARSGAGDGRTAEPISPGDARPYRSEPRLEDEPGAERSRGDGLRRALVALVVIAAALLGWLHLGAMIGEALPTSDMTAYGPGMGLFNFLNGFADFDAETRAAISALCGTEAGLRTLSDRLVVLAMWEAMVAAMMLPTALPVLLAHSDAARRAGEPAGRTTLAVGLGYLAVWTAFAVVATVAQELMIAARMATPAGVPASLVLSGTTLIAAGLYQFTPWKWSCLARCRRPGARFSTGRSTIGALRLGLAEGVDCLGCCFALMVAMFAVGVMNVVWIVGLGAVMILEKVTSSWWIVRFVGVVLIASGVAALAASPVGAQLLSRLF